MTEPPILPTAIDAPPISSPVIDHPPILAIVDVLDRDGRARVSLPVRRWPVTVGRAIGCDVVLDDPYVAPRHATITDQDGSLQLQVGETINGVWQKRRRVAAGERTELAAGDVVQIGGTRLRIRRAADALSPERPWVPEASGSLRAVLLLMLLFSAWNAADLWLHDDPGGRLTDYLPILIGGPIAVAVWSAFWSVGSKLIRHRFDFWSHVRIALLGTIGMGVAGLLLPVSAFASGWSWPSRIGPLVVSAIGWGAVGAHIGRLLPGRPRALAAVMGSLFVVGVGLYGIHHYESQNRVFPELYVATLAPPVLRVAPTVSTARFLDEAKALKAVLEAHLADDNRSTSGDD
ncbi:MAG: FHA domain-containing protein [Vicinamibacteraceae bacterium]